MPYILTNAAIFFIPRRVDFASTSGWTPQRGVVALFFPHIAASLDGVSAARGKKTVRASAVRWRRKSVTLAMTDRAVIAYHN
ncbi:MAG: hypothetical protein ABH839_04325 [Chloroflexota bacterium]